MGQGYITVWLMLLLLADPRYRTSDAMGQTNAGGGTAHVFEASA